MPDTISAAPFAAGRSRRPLPPPFPDDTWESSHLGGDRFAATMIVLPHGLYYGRVPTADAQGIVDRYLDGEIVERHYRGRSSLSNVAQAAQSFARTATGDVRIEAFPTLREERLADGSWLIDLAHDGDDRGSRPTRADVRSAAEHLRGDATRFRARVRAGVDLASRGGRVARLPKGTVQPPSTRTSLVAVAGEP